MEKARIEHDHVIDAILEINKTKYILAQLANKAFDAGGLGLSPDRFCDLLQAICSNPLENHNFPVKHVQLSDHVEKEYATGVTCRPITEASSVHSQGIAGDPHEVRPVGDTSMCHQLPRDAEGTYAGAGGQTSNKSCCCASSCGSTASLSTMSCSVNDVNFELSGRKKRGNCAVSDLSYNERVNDVTKRIRNEKFCPGSDEQVYCSVTEIEEYINTHNDRNNIRQKMKGNHGKSSLQHYHYTKWKSHTFLYIMC
jgi:hypothetical protein